ncbi:MAG: hypothetical protein LBD41_03175 [Clostridiales Family XIII bacterium]|jgi:hypothetical protein|nr:hypothetical protein [Clostridiales Family XIII bacterium]
MTKIWKEAGVWNAMYRGEVSGAFDHKSGAERWIKEQQMLQDPNKNSQNLNNI